MNDEAYALNEFDRRLASMISIGTVSEVDTDKNLAKVEIGDITTEWIPWTVEKAGKDRRWHAPDVGEQVVVFAPGGDLGRAVIGPSLFQDDFPANGDDVKLTRTTFKDGSVVEFDREVHALNITLHDDAVLKIKIGAMTIEVTKDLAKLGENANNFVALANKCKQEIDKLRNYLAVIHGVLTGSIVNEAGMGAPSVLHTVLNTALNAAYGSGVPTISDPAASKVKAE